MDADGKKKGRAGAHTGEMSADSAGMLDMLSGQEMERMATLLVDTGRYRVLRRLERRTYYSPPDDRPKRWALYVDVETTGLDPDHEKVIEFAGVPFEYCPSSGEIYRVGEALVCQEDPGAPLDPKIVTLTGIRDDDLRGKQFDEAAIEKLTEAASLIIAHNAFFDRRFLERRLPIFRTKPWACSHKEIPWEEEGFFSSKLEILIIKHCGAFHGAHRADGDCYAALHILATPLLSGRTPLSYLLEQARQPTIRLWAVGAPYDARELLRGRRYHWNDGRDGRPKAWHVEVAPERVDEGVGWLQQEVYGGSGEIKKERLTAVSRHTDR